MAITKKDNIIFWVLGLIILGFFTYAIKSILLPFVAAIICAYFLDPAVDRLEKYKLSRANASGIVIVAFFGVIILITILLAPSLYEQLMNFIHTVPRYLHDLNDKYIPQFSKMMKKIDPDTMEKAKDSAADVSGYALKAGANLVGNILISGIALINLLSLLIITPIVTFYMLRDWDLMVHRIDTCLPSKHAKTIREQVKEVDKILSSYLRGQTQVCVIYGVYCAAGLTLLGLQFGLVIGFATGVLLFLPYIGAIFGFVVGMIVAFFQFGDIQHMGMVAFVFLFGQLIESTIVTPNLVGNSVKLHPVWVMFALLAGGTMFGFLGILLAIPVASIIGVIVRFFFAKCVDKDHKAIA